MICKTCGTDMFIDHTEQEGNREVFVYKCPNSNCTNYGYAASENLPNAGAQMCCGEPIAYITASTYQLPNRTNATAVLNKDTNILTVVCPDCAKRVQFDVTGKELKNG